MGGFKKNNRTEGREDRLKSHPRAETMIQQEEGLAVDTGKGATLSRQAAKGPSKEEPTTKAR